MQFTKKSEYAVLSVLYLAKSMRVCDISEIAESQNLSASFAAKTLQLLAKAGILTSRRGIGGGYGLARPASKISLLELIEAVEGPLALSDYLKEGGSYGTMEHLLKLAMGEVQEAVATKLKGMTLADILAKSTRTAAHKNPVILCDFDGTVSMRDVSDTIFTIWLKDKWTDIDWEWHEGKISMVELYERCWSLVNATADELTAFVDTVEIDPYFGDFVSESKASNIPIYLVSDGFDYFIERILGRYSHSGLKYYANHLFFEGGKPALEFNNQNPACIQCANCKKFVMDAKRQQAGYVIYIGNGLSDRCAAEHADLVFAKDSLLKHCKEKGVPCVPYKNFGEILECLREKEVFGGEIQNP